MRGTLVVLTVLGMAGAVACESAPPVNWSPEPQEEVAAPEAAPAPPAPEDPDAVPAGALRRLGSSAFAHTDTILALAWQGDRIATASNDAVSVWNARSGWRLGRLNTPATELALSPDASIVALGRGGSRQVGLWRVGEPATYLTVSVGALSVAALAFSPDGALLAVASSTGQVTLVSPSTGERLVEIETGRRAVGALVFDATGGLLAVAGQDDRVQVLAVPTGDTVLEIETGEDRICDLAFSPSGDLIAVAARSSVDVSIFDAETGALWSTLRGHEGAVTAVAFLPGGDLLASTGLDQTVRRWSIDTAREVEPRIEPWTAGGVAHFSRWSGSDGQPRPRLALAPGGAGGLIAGWSNSLARFNWLTAGWVERPAGSGPITALAFSRDGQQVASGNRDGSVAVWGIDGELRGHLSGHRDPVTAVTFDGELLRARTTLEERTWDLATGRPRSVSGGQIRSPGSLQFDPDGRLAIGDYAQVVIRDPRSGLEWRVLETSPLEFVSLATAASGGTIALGRSGNSAALFEVRSGRYLGELPQLADQRTAVLSADGSFVAAAGRSRDVSVWSVASGERVFYFEPLNRVEHLALSPTGDHLVAGARGDLYLWELPSGRVRQPVFGGHVTDLAWSADGTHLAAAGLRQVMSYEVAAWSARHRVDVRGEAVALSSNGDLVAALRRGRVTIWRSGDLEPLIELDTESPRGQGSASASPSLAFSLDDTLIAAIDRFNRLTVWEVATGDRLRRLGDGQVEGGSNGNEAASADGAIQARVDSDGAVEVLRDGETEGIVVAHIQNLDAPVTSLALSPDGGMLAVGLANTTVVLWPVPLALTP